MDDSFSLHLSIYVLHKWWNIIWLKSTQIAKCQTPETPEFDNETRPCSAVRPIYSEFEIVTIDILRYFFIYFFKFFFSSSSCHFDIKKI